MENVTQAPMNQVVPNFVERVIRYQDGTTRKVTIDAQGEIQEFVNPSGTHWKRRGAETWRVFSISGTEVPSSPITAQVKLEADLTLVIEQVYPFKLLFRQEPTGSYIHEIDNGALETWNAKERRKIEYWSNGEVIVMQYLINEQGLLVCTRSALSQEGKLDDFCASEGAYFQHPI